MLHKNTIETLLIDYGGTVDTDGIHWSVVLRDRYRQLQIPVSDDDFREAYIHGERTLATNPLIKPEHNFYDLLLIKAEIQLERLVEKGLSAEQIRDARLAEQIAQGCYDFARNTTAQAKLILDRLAARYSMVLVSNFYGNIRAVLRDFGLLCYFPHIVESAVVGVRKPDPAIWQLGAQAVNTTPDRALVIGDSYDKDIIPGKQAGCQTVWLEAEGWNKITDHLHADEKIHKLDELCKIL